MAALELNALVAQVDETVAGEASVVTFLQGIGSLVQTSVDAALAADDAADQGSIDAANAAIAETVAKLAASKTVLADALANAGTQPPPPPPVE